MTKHYDYIAIGGGSGGIAGRHLRERRLRTEESDVARGANP